jgi:hypothetical protein
MRITINRMRGSLAHKVVSGQAVFRQDGIFCEAQVGIAHLGVRSEPPARSHHPEIGHFALYVVLFVKPARRGERRCDFDQLRGHGVYRIGFTLAVASHSE